VRGRDRQAAVEVVNTQELAPIFNGASLTALGAGLPKKGGLTAARAHRRERTLLARMLPSVMGGPR
jgi:hypothetical protein